ncbi:CPBP family intramembrane glutamic endopeptidase [Halonatronum saccharophilum]|uniref:CPBP family intramembrane glutamic endopeptidase n=1 Tax=Halonatronum saccharophilum TaxID=150060 RepID=UPI00047FFC84|nr:type II CAAX endopeptidase family protein [Halonatronum saccharophilum]
MSYIVEKETGWKFIDIIIIIILTLLFTILFFFSFKGLTKFLGVNLDPSIKPLVLNFMQAILLVIITVFFLKVRYKISFADLGFKLDNLSTIMKYGIFGGVGICLSIIFINNIFYQLVNNLFGWEAPAQEVIQNLLDLQSNTVFLLYSILIVVVAPITEEIFFRGLIYFYCKDRFGVLMGMLLNGIIFGVAHSSLWLFIPTFLGGVLLAWIYEKSKSIYSCIIAHSVWNLIIVLLVYIFWRVNLI